MARPSEYFSCNHPLGIPLASGEIYSAYEDEVINLSKVLDVWARRLGVVCITNTLLVSVQVTLLKKSLNTRHMQKESDQAVRNLGLVIGLILYVLTTVISFLGRFIIIQHRIRLERSLQDYIFEMSPRMSVGAEYEDQTENDKEKIMLMGPRNHAQLQEVDSIYTPLNIFRVQLYAPPHQPCLTPGDADHDPEATQERPHIRVWLFARLYKLCLILTVLAVLTSSVGVV